VPLCSIAKWKRMAQVDPAFKRGVGNPTRRAARPPGVGLRTKSTGTVEVKTTKNTLNSNVAFRVTK